MKRLFRARVAYHRIRRHIRSWRHPLPWAMERGDPARFPVVVAERSSPLARVPDGPVAAYTDGKTHNLRLAARAIGGIVVHPGRVFSFCRTVGKTTARKDYLPALELRGEGLVPAMRG